MINIVANNHSSQVHIQDFLEYIYIALRSTGEEPTYGIGEWTLSGANIVLEGGHSRFNDDIIKAKTAYPQLKIFLIVTEFVVDGFLNSANISFEKESENKDHYSNKDYWIKRTQDLNRLLPYVNGIICLNSILFGQYKLIHPNCFHLPLLKLKQSNKLEHKKNKIYDFVFSGTITPYRKEIIQQICENGYKVAALDSSTPQYIRDSIYSDAHAVLCPRLHENTITFSNMRAYYCLSNRLPHIFEFVTSPCDMARFVNFSPSKNFIVDAINFRKNIANQKFKFQEFEIYSNENKNTIFQSFKKWLRN